MEKVYLCTPAGSVYTEKVFFSEAGNVFENKPSDRGKVLIIFLRQCI